MARTARRALWIVAAVLIAAGALDWEAGALLRPRVLVGGRPGGFVVKDSLLGFAPKPKSLVRVELGAGGRLIYRAVYTIDSAGFRLTRGSLDPKADTAVFLGDSYTFGDGLNDQDALPQQYSAARGYRDRVLNAAFSGYGTHQALRLLQSDRLAGRLGQGRRTFIYPVIEEHVRRIEGRAPWDWWGTPQFRLERGQVRYAGRYHQDLAGRLQAPWRTSALGMALGNNAMLEPRPESTALFGAMVQQAQRTARDRFGADLVVVLWDEPILRDAHDVGRARRRAAMVERIATELTRRGVRFWRISQLIPDYPARMGAYVIPSNGHPSALLNRRLAAALAARL